MKKILLILLALLVCVFSSCSEATETSAIATTSQSPKEQIGDISGDFNILVVGNQEWNDFAAEESDEALVDIAIYERNKELENKYGVTVTTDEYMGFAIAMGQGTGFQKVYNNVMSATPVYDAAMIGTYDVATLAYNGLLQDLCDAPFIDLSKEHWDQKATNDLAINGKMYYTTGDISVVDNRSTHALFFNKEMIENYGMDNPYDLVKSGNWTLEKFGAMVKQIGADNNNDGVYDKNDTFGLLSARDNNLAILAAAGEKICNIDDHGKISLSLYNERVDTLYSRYLDIVDDDTHTFNWKYNYITGAAGDQASNEERVSMFDNDQALFYFHMLSYTDFLREIDTNFGILPFPKYDENQEEYGHYVSAWHSQFLCLPLLVENKERSGFVIEKLAELGAGGLTSAYYEKTLQGKYVRDAESSAMLDLIFDTRVYDVGVYYNIGGYKDEIGYILERGSSLSVFYEKNKLLAEQQIEQINEYFSKHTAN